MINIQSKSAFNKKNFSVPLILFEKSFSVPLIVFEKLEMKSRRGEGLENQPSRGGGSWGTWTNFPCMGKKSFFPQKFPENGEKTVQNV